MSPLVAVRPALPTNRTIDDRPFQRPVDRRQGSRSVKLHLLAGRALRLRRSPPILRPSLREVSTSILPGSDLRDIPRPPAAVGMGVVVVDEVPEITTTTHVLLATTTDHRTTHRTETTHASWPRIPATLNTTSSAAAYFRTRHPDTLFCTRNSRFPGLDQRALPWNSET